VSLEAIFRLRAHDATQLMCLGSAKMNADRGSVHTLQIKYYNVCYRQLWRIKSLCQPSIQLR
jgi:CRISPR/Cas system-associated exonuclease Cas4 (RecB family)